VPAQYFEALCYCFCYHCSTKGTMSWERSIAIIRLLNGGYH
jgi:hypothetical protein